MISPALGRRAFLQAAGGLAVSFALPISAVSAPRQTDGQRVEGFISLGSDGRVTLYCGKVDLGQGLRIAIPQMVAEELGIGIGAITLVEGDTDLTPDQGPTTGSTGVAKGGVQIRQAAATLRRELIALAARRLDVDATSLDIQDGAVRLKEREGVSILLGELVPADGFSLASDAAAPLRSPAAYKVVGQPLPRPDVPAKVMGRHSYIHDFKVPGMLHGRVLRPPAVGARLLEVDDSRLKTIKGVRVIRREDFLAVVAERDWDADRAARLIAARWSDNAPLMGAEAVRSWLKAGPFAATETLTAKGDVNKALEDPDSRVVRAEYFWPVQSHASLGPSCAVADVQPGHATIWTASQATHRFRPAFAALLGLAVDKVRLIYRDGSGCYGMNGHDDAAADAALLSQMVGRPVRVQWSRADELGWDPKGPPQLLALEGALDDENRLVAWKTRMWLPKATASLPNVPLLAPEAAGIPQPKGLITGGIAQNGAPSYAIPNLEVEVNWHADAPLRPSNIRAPGKIANAFAVESFFDELCAAARLDPLVARLQRLKDLRAITVVTRAASLLGWAPRPSPGPGPVGRGLAFVHYKQSETYVAMAMEAEVDRESGLITVTRVVCAHDCGLVINPDALKLQIEGAILQTLSRTLMEEVAFDTRAVTSTGWDSYPILTFDRVPAITVDLVSRPDQPPLGGGEAACTPVPAALANAVYDACGARLRTVPFLPERVKAALAEAEKNAG